jgi:hypothetical protein
VRISYCSRLFVIFFLTFSSLWIASAADFEKLSVPGGLAIAIDPMKSVAVSEPFNITNETAKPSSLDLRLDSFVSLSTHLTSHGATAKLTLDNAESSKGQSDSSPGVLAPKATILARIEVRGFIESGEYSLGLYNGTVPLGSVKITGAPFKIHTEAADGTAMPVVVGPDSLNFTVRNDDPVTYPVRWELAFGSTTLDGTALLRPGATDIAYALAENPAQPRVLSANAWERFCSYLRDGAFDGRLRVTLATPDSSQRAPVAEAFAPVAAFPVKVSLRHQSPELTTIYGSFALVFVLTLGAIASLIATLYIPHTLRKNALQSRLILAIRRVRELSPQMPSRGRISAEVDCLQIAGRLRNEGAFYSDFEAILLDYETQISALESRVGLMGQVDFCQQVLEAIPTMAIPPSLITMAREPLEQLNKMFDGGEWTPEQLGAAATLVDNLKHRVSDLSAVKSSGRIDEAVQNKIKSELARMKTCLPSPRTGFAARLADALPGIFAILDGTPADTPDRNLSDWTQMDVALWKLGMVWRFASAYEATKNPAWRARLEEKAGLPDDQVRTGTLLYYLELSTWDGLNCAELLCTQVDQGSLRKTFAKRSRRAVSPFRFCKNR